MVSNVLQNHQPDKPKIDSKGRSYGTGKRKESVARVWIKAGSGKVVVNNMELSKYFKRGSLCRRVYLPFNVTSTTGCYDVIATVAGGGISGQAGALAHGVSKALKDINPSLHPILRQAGLLTRDSRIVERKKYGQHKARKKCQFSKR
ncbi:30S ribosomal protein S9 [Neoehrlichia mikurensis]|uniref:Small ribosomal subunit protein uS9 n=1 Tax=Neoehrlichia mikurensis TaxID=89586 RepID=A0A9Q9BVI7_9RICK|nr:30S ribosomal protein S9 [Neoehrlichia mikurensis]QXK91659.1 30S ribosomal protein S9 [Neoehrlichia mikurensis]QXK92870.1 30S ribosomal protein S9 [Neoehrlichia mikurensis]QXK93350.1 30S ribosomal protein S9 [Neoehrlichia mikurensis]UTO55706.1 30S ribosomal protein S9 [Neoehrlichia mikurensis]UTO56623.1 30S ribosomal protein S9 [Neoehrlichia mikurensis]